METNYKPKLGVLGLIGLIFAPIGLLFLVLGILIPAEKIEGSALAFKGVFCGTGGLFLVLGILFLFLTVQKNSRIKALIAAGNYIMADFAGASLDTSVTVNGQNPYRAQFQFTDPLGMVHVFRSGILMTDPTPMLAGRQVRVYVDQENYDNYYADIDSVMKIH